MSHLLAADIGGTKALVALASSARPWPNIVAQHSYACADFNSLEGILDDFLARPEVAAHAPAITAACFSVAGPVAEGGTTLTNLKWRIEAGALAARFGWSAVALINDFAAAGIGISRLAAEDLATLQAGHAREHGVRLVIGAGTGLGVGWLTWDGSRYVAHPSEAGHVDFAPADELQDRLLVYLRRSFGRVSWERVVSGPGLKQIYSFLHETGEGTPTVALAEALKKQPDTARVVGEFGLAALDPLAVRALDVFVTAYGAFAGDMALATLAHNGVYVAGGIAPKIRARLNDGAFMRAFVDKGRYRQLLQAIPVHVVLNPQVGLYGALLEAERIGAVKK
jgi:glucokinase